MKKALLVLAIFISVNCAYAKNTVLFSPKDNIKETLIRDINNSKKTIEVMIFSITDKDIADALLKARDRGVKVRMIVDKKNSFKLASERTVVPFLKKKGLNIKRVSGEREGIMHNKVAIFDGTELVTGSFNWTHNANTINFENTIFTDDTEVVKKYKIEFERIWQNNW